jgi:hypothetical protein
MLTEKEPTTNWLTEKDLKINLPPDEATIEADLKGTRN